MVVDLPQGFFLGFFSLPLFSAFALNVYPLFKIILFKSCCVKLRAFTLKNKKCTLWNMIWMTQCYSTYLLLWSASAGHSWLCPYETSDKFYYLRTYCELHYFVHFAVIASYGALQLPYIHNLHNMMILHHYMMILQHNMLIL